MIEKIISLQNVGKFIDYKCSGDVQFRGLTLIFGENGLGKTTLSAIFRSLVTGNVDYMTERCTVGQDASTYAEMRVCGDSACCDGNRWTGTPPKIEIFDPTFINENVYAGLAVEHEHRRRLHSFALGEKGVLIGRQIEGNTADIRDINARIAEKKAAIEGHITAPMTFDIFLNLKQTSDIAQRITAQKKEIETLAKAESIDKKPTLSTLLLPDLQFGEIEKLLQKTIEQLSGDAERKVKEHISRCMDEKGEGWLDHGMNYIKDDRCPFCGEGLRSIALVQAYREFFGDAYNNHKKQITEMSEWVKRTLSQDKLLSLQERVNTNESLSEFWREHVDSDFPSISFADIRDSWEKMLRLLTEHLTRKAASPLDEIVSGEDLRNAMDVFKRLNREIEKYNRDAERLNLAIKEKKGEVKEADIEIQQGLLQWLENLEKRFFEAVDSLCREHVALQTEKKELEEKKKEAKQELDEYTSELLGKYQSQINEHLRRFGAGFAIDKTKQTFMGKGPSLSYCISIRGVAIDLEAPQKSGPTPCFKNTLSSGDKSSLAFAFFLAKLDLDRDLEDKVVVFDDPISSLDDNRKTCTHQEVVRISRRAKQVIVLSHDIHFLRSIWSARESQDIKALRIHRSGEGSVISSWEIEQATHSQYYRDHSTLLEYLSSGTKGELSKIATCIRRVLEETLRHRCPVELARARSLGPMISQIREASEGTPLMSLNPALAELSAINDYSKQFHHGAAPGSDPSATSDSELRGYVERTFSIVRGI